MTFGRFSGCGGVRFAASAGIFLAGNGGHTVMKVRNRPVTRSTASFFFFKMKAIWPPVEMSNFTSNFTGFNQF